MNNSHRLLIEGMHCGACVRRVTTAIQGVEGAKVDSVEVGSATVTLNPSHTSAENVILALKRIGFPAAIAS